MIPKADIPILANWLLAHYGREVSNGVTLLGRPNHTVFGDYVSKAGLVVEIASALEVFNAREKAENTQKTT